MGFYCSSKAAIESLHESLAAEVEQFGIKVTLIAPGAYETTITNATLLKATDALHVYDDMRKRVFGGLAGEQRGDPHAISAHCGARSRKQIPLAADVSGGT